MKTIFVLVMITASLDGTPIIQNTNIEFSTEFECEWKKDLWFEPTFKEMEKEINLAPRHYLCLPKEVR